MTQTLKQKTKPETAEEEPADESGLVQRPLQDTTDEPVYWMLLETFLAALEKYSDRDKRNIAARMLATLQQLLADGVRAEPTSPKPQGSVGRRRQRT